MLSIHYFSSGPRERVLKALINEGYHIKTVWVTPEQKTPKISPTITLAKQNGINLKFIESKAQLNDIEHFIKDEVVLSIGFAYLFSESFINQAKIALNAHGTLLPNYAGARTLNWVIVNGEEYSGVTIHKIDKGMDTGPILLQKKIPLSEFDTGKSLYRKTLEFEPSVILEALSIYSHGQATFENQDYSNVTTWPNRTPEHSALDPSVTLNELYNQIRACDPVDYPAYFYVKGQKVYLKLWRDDKKNDAPDTL
ncbi:MAG: hypothetical protein NE334_17870 [Lentisphaeraceae bacterium]|nr:hypothetical protein [Lentisphaeraceae bacterium]